MSWQLSLQAVGYADGGSCLGFPGGADSPFVEFERLADLVGFIQQIGTLPGFGDLREYADRVGREGEALRRAYDHEQADAGPTSRTRSTPGAGPGTD